MSCALAYKLALYAESFVQIAQNNQSQNEKEVSFPGTSGAIVVMAFLSSHVTEKERHVNNSVRLGCQRKAHLWGVRQKKSRNRAGGRELCRVMGSWNGGWTEGRRRSFRGSITQMFRCSASEGGPVSKVQLRKRIERRIWRKVGG